MRMRLWRQTRTLPDALFGNAPGGRVPPESRTTSSKTRHICPSFILYKTVSAKGAVFHHQAWGNAPGFSCIQIASAEGAIQWRAFPAFHQRNAPNEIGPLNRAFSAYSSSGQKS